MNFLAHIYLSGENKEIALGNLIGDMVKGQAYLKYEENIRIGLILHRNIDFFTDNHQVFKHSRKLISPHFHRYSGIVTDIYYDHFLAKNWNEYCQTPLQEQVNEIYRLLIKNYLKLPYRAQRITPFMIIRNWLGTYGSNDHLHQIFLGMHRRTLEKGNMHKGLEVLLANYEELEQDFRLFFDDIRIFSGEKLRELTTIHHQPNPTNNQWNTQ